ncbi:PadR family transcriptional regulator [Microbacterium sp. SS28]|uniref:PadR family transcriptional regulator n=1 Tax=Microbacterium sp. SS28 TaxID=2919948 RepID=UPI001FA992D5|nr:helix-turn-helix transcriptional regulator [Microbacterium sp. SS28]
MSAEALKGHLDGLLLATLEDGPLHGYAVIEALREGSSGHFDLPTGTVYPALRRLEAAGLVRSGWSVVSGRRRRTYEITPAGRRALTDQRTVWDRFSDAVNTLMRPRAQGAT